MKQLNQLQDNRNIYNTQMDYSDHHIFPCYQASPVFDDLNTSVIRTSMNKADIKLTCTNIRTASRKRSRVDSINDNLNAPQTNRFSGSLLDQDIIFQIHRQQSETDRFVALHTERVRLKLEERRKRQSSILTSTIQERITKKLNEKDEEIERMRNLNLVLQERVKSLCFENQIWRDLAHSNEATANSLRTNLGQVLAHQDLIGGWSAAEASAGDDASSCGSCSDDDRNSSNKCRKCLERETGVLLLPCRHLCVCTVCGSTIHDCPVCNSVINITVHVNLSNNSYVHLFN